jgi:outer membrane protein OmpA-like peptidoglycan-associated protein
MTIKYKPGGVTVTIGKSQDVSLPTRVFRGRATCMHFDTDKSFLLPPSIDGVRNIVTFYNRHPGMTMLVNGHTDAQGGAAYNLPLSNERAQSVAAYLQDNVDAWMAWYDNPQPSKRWGAHEDTLMRQKLRDEGQTPPDDRRALVTAYMGLQGTSMPQGSPPIVTHGCGLFHLAVQTQAACEENRRVEIFLFDGAVDPAPQDPCPSPGCTQYPQWVGNPEEDIDLCKPMDPPGVCATFFVGTTQNDDQLSLARKWAEAIVTSVGDAKRAQLATLLSTRDLLNQLIQFEDIVEANPKAASPPALAGIEEPTVIWITRALSADGTGPQAVRFYGVDDSGQAMTITADDLDHVQLQATHLVADDPSNADLVALASALDFLRVSSYKALYLCAVGAGRAVDQVAQKLASLIGKIVYYNTSPLVLSEDDNGALEQPQVGVTSAAQGQGYQGGSVSLQAADAQSFLPGSEGRAS